MEMPGTTIAEGFLFKTSKDAAKAIEEEKRIKYIKTKLDYSSPRSVKIIYDKMLKNRIFETPVGYSFLKDTYDYLIKSNEFDENTIAPIPMTVSFTDKEYDVRLEVKKKTKPGEVEHIRGSLRVARIVIAVLIVAIISMFVITLQSENPNIINYKIALENKYATWDQELTERENELRKREAALKNE